MVTYFHVCTQILQSFCFSVVQYEGDMISNMPILWGNPWALQQEQIIERGQIYAKTVKSDFVAGSEAYHVQEGIGMRSKVLKRILSSQLRELVHVQEQYELVSDTDG